MVVLPEPLDPTMRVWRVRAERKANLAAALALAEFRAQRQAWSGAASRFDDTTKRSQRAATRHAGHALLVRDRQDEEPCSLVYSEEVGQALQSRRHLGVSGTPNRVAASRQDKIRVLRRSMLRTRGSRRRACSRCLWRTDGVVPALA